MVRLRPVSDTCQHLLRPGELLWGLAPPVSGIRLPKGSVSLGRGPVLPCQSPASLLPFPPAQAPGTGPLQAAAQTSRGVCSGALPPCALSVDGSGKYTLYGG